MAIVQTDSQPIVSVTAKEFMFGYESALTTLGNDYLPGWIFFDKVGLIDRVSNNNKYATHIWENTKFRKMGKNPLF